MYGTAQRAPNAPTFQPAPNFRDPEAAKAAQTLLPGSGGKLWPVAFLLSCLAIFGAPMLAIFRLAREPSVQYWVGPWGYLTVMIPMLMGLSYAVHVSSGRPRLVPVVFSTVIPSLILIAVANIHLSSTSNIANMLVSSDCSTYQRKSTIQSAWVIADRLYDECLNRTATQHGLSYQEGQKLFRFDECSEYQASYVGNDDEKKFDEYADHRPIWDFLRGLELQESCGGWCKAARPLWTFEEPKDSCSLASGASLANKVKPVAVQLLTYSFLVLLLSIGFVSFLSHEYHKVGMEW